MSGDRGAFSIPEAAAFLGIGETAFREHVLPRLRVVRVGRKPIVPRAELDRFLDRHASAPLRDELGAWRR